MAEMRHFYPELTIISDNMGMEADNNLIEVQRHNIKDSERNFDPAVYTAARIFNAVAPDNMPDFLKESIEQKAEQAKISAQEAGFVAPDTNRLIDGKTIQERERDKDEETRLYVTAIIEDERRERERVWDNSRVTIGTVAMSGQEWDDALELLSDPRLREQLIQNMTRKKGWTQDRAEKAADDALTLAQIAQKKKDGTMTAADEANADDISRRNPDAAVMVKEAARLYQEQGLKAASDQSVCVQSRLSGDISIAAQAQMQAVQDATLREEADGAFRSAPALSSHFDAARNEALSSQVEEAKVKPMPPRPVSAVDITGPY